MALNTAYVGEFTDFEGRLCKVLIQQEGYAGTVKQMVLGGTPIKLISTETELQEPIVGLGCEIEILSEEGDNYSPLFLAPPLTWKVTVDVADEIIFQGYVNNETYQEEYLNAPFYITLTASDGLKGLEVFEPEFLQDRANIPLIEVIANCLENTGMRLPIEVKNTLCSEDMSLFNGTKSLSNQVSTLFDKTQVLQGAFNSSDGYLSTKEVLEKVLQPFNCKIYQDGTVWRIDRLNDKYDYNKGVKYIRYDFDGSITNKTISATNTEIKTIGNIDNPWLNSSQTREVQQPYSRQTIVGDLGESGNQIPAINNNTLYVYDSSWSYPDSVLSGSPQTLRWNTNNIGNDRLEIVNSGKRLEAFDLTYNNGGWKFKAKSGEDVTRVNDDITIDAGYGSGHWDATEWYYSTIAYKTPVTFSSWKQDYESDTLNLKARVDVKLADTTDILPEFNYMTPSASESKIMVPFYVILEDSTGNKKWLKYHDGYSFTSYDHESRGDFRHTLEFRTEAIQGTFSLDLDVSISNGTTTAPTKEDYSVNQSLEDTRYITFLLAAPFYNTKYGVATGAGAGSTRLSLAGSKVFPDGIILSAFELSIDEKSEYNNTVTGVLDARRFTREAPELKIGLWNPTKVGNTQEQRGLVSSTSSWWNRNTATNLLKYYSSYTNTSNLDDNSGLGLWYTLEEYIAKGNSTDLGHRLPAILMRSYYQMYLNEQEIFRGDMYLKNPLKFKDIYTVAGAEGKRFILQSREYNVRDCEATISLFELRGDEINVNN